MKEKAEEPKELELCAIPKEMAVEKLNALIEANQEIFKEYFLWTNVINSTVNVVKTPIEQDTEKAKSTN